MQRYWTESTRRDVRIDFFVLILLILFGGFLRFWNLGVPSFWVDEVNVVFAADSFAQKGDFSLPSGSVHTRAPLYTYSVAFFYKIFDVSETSTRLSSALFGLLSILVVYFLGKKVFNRRVGLLSAFLMAFSHFEVGWSRTAKTYALLQLLTLIIVYSFIRGFEDKDQQRNSLQDSDSHSSFLTRTLRSLKQTGISPLWLVVCVLLIGVATFYVHLLTVFLLGGFFLYLLFMTMICFISGEGSGRIWNKYVISSLLTVFIALVVWVASPALRQLTHEFLYYTPPWAVGPASAQRRIYLFEFLISSQRFPLAAFFFVGGLQLMSRKNKLGWIPMCGFLTPFFLLTFVFTHRVPMYIFYVYPFFLMISAFGFMNILEAEQRLMKKDTFIRVWFRRGVFAMYLFIFIVSPWLRITLHIPFQGDGVSNMAVTTDEWREASMILREHKKEGDLIISSLPQVVLYYGIRSDYGLNWSNLEQSKEREFRNDSGRWVDVYAGVVCIESLDELKKIIRIHPRGWILVTKYHLEHEIVTPIEVREFIQEQMGTVLETEKGTVLIYQWSQPLEENV